MKDHVVFLGYVVSAGILVDQDKVNAIVEWNSSSLT